MLLNNDLNIEISQHKFIVYLDKQIKFAKTFKLLDVIFDNRLNFEDHAVSISKKVNSITDKHI